MGSMVIETTSPSCKNTGGSYPMPTPTGVPVAMMSPAISVIPDEIAAIKVGISKINSDSLASWRSSSLMRVVR